MSPDIVDWAAPVAGAFLTLVALQLRHTYPSVAIVGSILCALCIGLIVGIDRANDRARRPISVDLDSGKWKIERPDAQTYVFRKETP